MNLFKKRFHQAGVTLIELLVTLSIIAILSSCAFSYLLPPLFTTKVNLLSHEVLHHLKYARTEAIKRNQIVGLCGMENANACSSNWDKGYLIFAHEKSRPDQKQILKVCALDQKASILCKFHNCNNTIRFTPEGRAQKNGRLIIVSKYSDLSQTIMVSLTGRARFN